LWQLKNKSGMVPAELLKKKTDVVAVQTRYQTPAHIQARSQAPALSIIQNHQNFFLKEMATVGCLVL